MKAKITNLLRSPFDLDGAGGRLLLPALGTVVSDFTDDYLHMLSVCGAVRVEAIHESAENHAQRRKAKKAGKASDRARRAKK